MGVEDDAAAPPVGGGHLDRFENHRVETEGPGLEGGLVAPGQLGQVADQRGELVQLGQHVGDQHLAFLGRELLHPSGHLEIGLEAGQRSAQLVGGVEHQLALALA